MTFSLFSLLSNVPFSVLAQVGRFLHNLSVPSVSVLRFASIEENFRRKVAPIREEKWLYIEAWKAQQRIFNEKKCMLKAKCTYSRRKSAYSKWGKKHFKAEKAHNQARKEQERTLFESTASCRRAGLVTGSTKNVSTLRSLRYASVQRSPGTASNALSRLNRVALDICTRLQWATRPCNNYRS